MNQLTYSRVMDQVSNLPGHSLRDLKKAQLMNRIDTKFIMPASLLPNVFEAMDDQYSVLEINGIRCFHYETTYFDTDDHRFYHMHRTGRLNRFKVRVRRYVDSDVQFLEVKLKNNKKRTIKERVPLPDHNVKALSDNIDFLQSVKVPAAEQLRPCLHNSYQRIALASETRGERLTFDIKLANRVADAEGEKLPLDNIVIVELKQSRLDRSSPFFALARILGIRPSTFSKYCMGMTLALCNTREWKYNRFKPILRRIAHDQQLRTV